MTRAKRQSTARSGPSSAAPPASPARETRAVSRLRSALPYLVLVVSAALVAAGLLLGEFRDVLANAITICLSCIGID